MTRRGYAFALAGVLMLAALPACARASPATLCDSQTLAVSGGAYTLQNNEWGSAARECITTNGGTGFRVATSSIAHAISGGPGGYPSLYKGCHWGACTSGSGLPIQVSGIRAGTVTTSWRTTQPGGRSVYNVAYDVWFSKTPTAGGHPHGAELMIWLNQSGQVHPAGSQLASGVSIGGRSYDVWGRVSGGRTISYAMTSGATSVSHLDLQPLVTDAVSRGYIRSSWYLIDVEAGFEIWQGGAGLGTKSFSVSVAGP
jgi:Glycosyl hydrolase family 12